MTRLFHVSDLHFGKEDVGALAWFADAVAADPPDMVVVTGDLTQRAKRSEFAAAARWLADLAAPVAIEEGNHDLPYFNLIERFYRPYARVGKAKRLAERRVDLDGVHLVSMKTTARFQLRLNWSYGHVDAKSIAAAERDAAEAGEGEVVIVCCHHPLIDLAGTEANGNTRGGEAAFARLRAAGADAILSGHVHTPFDVTHDGVRMIGAGTLSERLREHRPSYNESIVENREIAVAHHAFA